MAFEEFNQLLRQIPISSDINFAAYNTSNFNIVKFLVPVLSPLTVNNSTVDNPYKFANRLTGIPNAEKYP